MLNEISEKLKTIHDNESIYLLKKISNDSGFFACKNNILYMVKNFENNISKTITTEFIKLYTNIDIISVKNDNQFQSGKYNILEFVNSNNSEKNQETFVNLCIAHTENLKCKDFVNFFYSLIDIFQLPEEQEYKNLLGYYGELAFIEYVNDNINKDLSTYWHKGSLNSKYDFCLENFNLEVKTTLNDSTGITIKHNQLFNKDRNVLAVIVLEKHQSGLTFNQLVQKMLSNKQYNSNYNFILNIEKIKKCISPSKAAEEKLRIKEILLYDAESINPFSDLPENIYELSYKIDLPQENSILKDFLQWYRENIEE